MEGVGAVEARVPGGGWWCCPGVADEEALVGDADEHGAGFDEFAEVCIWPEPGNLRASVQGEPEPQPRLGLPGARSHTPRRCRRCGRRRREDAEVAEAADVLGADADGVGVVEGGDEAVGDVS